MNICTIIAKNYIAHATVLAESFNQHHPNGNVTVLVIDDFDGYIDPTDVPFDLLDIDSIGLDEKDRMAASYDVMELSTAVKPWLLRHLLGEPGCDAITYLDPDIWILDDLEEIDRMAVRHGLVLNPHFTHPLPADGLMPGDRQILAAGAYNLGMMSIRAGPEADGFLDWWSSHLLHDCIVDQDGGLFVDQRWMDLAPSLWDDPYLLRDPGYNLAYWNLPSRDLQANGDDYTVDGRPLRFFHFSGFDPLRPGELSKHQNRIDLSSRPTVASLCEAYAAVVLEAGHEEARRWPYGWDTLPNGLRLDRFSRRLHRRAAEDELVNGSVFTRKGANNLVAYLAGPEEHAAPDSGFSRYLGEIRRSREDLTRAFPDISGSDAARFVNWIHENTDSLEIPTLLRPERRSNGAPSAARDPKLKAGGVNLAGYLSSELGVGEAARRVSHAMSDAGIEQALIDIPPAAAEIPRELGSINRERAPFAVNLLCVNADMVPEFAGGADPTFLADRYSIGLWFWEVGMFPESYRSSFGPLDEIWVATSHVADAVRPRAPIPVEAVRLPVAPKSPAPMTRAELGMPEEFCFLFVFDHRSVIRRKNPFGLIDAFTKTFGSASDVSLVVKSMGEERHPKQASELRKAAAAHENVRVIEGVVSADVKNAMMASCDCYASLHRSEGFGLTMAEAMYFGKPVIATGYSGNLDFMSDDNSYLVAYEMTRIGDDAPPYPPDGTWAEPDSEHASSLMRHVTENRREAAQRGERAAADIRKTHSPQAAGEVIQSRLSAASKRAQSAPTQNRTADRPARPRQEPAQAQPEPILGDLLPAPVVTATGLAQLRHLLAFEEAPPKPGGSWFRRVAKRAYLRLLRPYVAYQVRINQSTAQAVEEVRDDVARRYVEAEQRERRELEMLAERLREEHDLLSRTVEAELTPLKQRLDDQGARVDRLATDQAELAGTMGVAIGDVDERLASAEAGAETMGDAIGDVDKRLASAEAGAETMGDAIGDVDKRLASAEAGAETMGDAIGDVDKRLASAEAGAETMGDAIGDVDKRLASAEAGAETMGDAIGDVDKRLASAEAGAETMGDAIGDVDKRLASAEAGAETMGDAIGDVDKRLASAEAGAETMGDAIGDVDKRLASAEAGAETMGDAIGDVDKRLASAEAGAETMGDAIGDVDKRLASAEAGAETMGDAIGDVDKRLASAEAGAETMGDAIGDVDKRLASAEAGAETMGDAIGDVDKRLASAEAGAETMGDAIGDVDKRLASAEAGAAQLLELETRMAEAENLLQAAAGPLFSADQFFETEDHPALGTVVGFSEPAKPGAAGVYKGFEDVFRGSESEIGERQKAYVELMRGFAPVLDVGCGRGEFLDVLRGAGMEYRGIDIDPSMVERCREKGHEKVSEADLTTHLDELSDNALGSLFSAQVVEHLDFEQLKQFLTRGINVLRPGGLFIAETVNPHSPQAMRTFWLDPTHQTPLFPEVMLTLCRLSGYASAVVFFPNGTGDFKADRMTQGDYAIIARAPEQGTERSDA